MKALVLCAGVLLGSQFAMAEGESLVSACKAECPKAKSEHEAHACLDKLAKTKKNDAKWKESACFKAYKAHEEHEKKEGHGDEHGDHKH